MQCIAAKGDLPIDIQWYFNGRQIVHNENGISILKMNSKTSVLNIDTLKDNHRGVYKCMAKNQAGHAEIESHLFINGTFNNNLIVFVYLLLRKKLASYIPLVVWSIKFLPRLCPLTLVMECPTLKIAQLPSV